MEGNLQALTPTKKPPSHQRQTKYRFLGKTSSRLRAPSLRTQMNIFHEKKTKPNQTKSTQTKPNQIKPNRTKPNQTKPNQIKQNQTEPNQIAKAVVLEPGISFFRVSKYVSLGTKSNQSLFTITQVNYIVRRQKSQGGGNLIKTFALHLPPRGGESTSTTRADAK
jgi:hypothetical protein